MINHHESCSRANMSRKFVRMEVNCRNLYQAAWFVHEVESCVREISHISQSPLWAEKETLRLR